MGTTAFLPATLVALGLVSCEVFVDTDFRAGDVGIETPDAGADGSIDTALLADIGWLADIRWDEVLSGEDAPSDDILSVDCASVDAPAVIDLTSEGSVDWVHWGLIDATSIDSKRTPTHAIGALIPKAIFRDTETVGSFSWSDGDPTASASAVATAVGGARYADITVAGGADTRTFRLYGYVIGSGSVEATLDSGRHETRPCGGAGLLRAAVTFRPSTATGLLLVRWIVSGDADVGAPVLRLAAGTLR